MDKRMMFALALFGLVAVVAGTMCVGEGEYEVDAASDVWDGTTVDTSWYSDADATEYSIGTAAQLAGLAQLVNEGNTFNDKTIKLTADIDLNNKQWTPIGNITNKFSGDFDGQNHVITNLYAMHEGKSYIGLFGFTVDGEVKNLTVDNAKLKGRIAVGVVAGSPYTSKYTNIAVTGHVEVDGLSYVGTVAGRNVYANWTNITVNVDETSYVNGYSVEGSTNYRTYVGGVVGFMAEGKHTMSNVTSNIDVIGSTCDVGGVVGIAHYGNTFVNCSSSGDVTLTGAIGSGDEKEIGGIAGVWMNSTKGDVTFGNCEFTGTLKTFLDGVDMTSGLTGHRYDITGNKYHPDSDDGKLILTSCNPCAPSFAPSGGEYIDKVDVTLSGFGSIFYTVDGSTPSPTNGKAYSGSFTLTQSCTVKAIIYDEVNNITSSVAEASFTIKTEEKRDDGTTVTESVTTEDIEIGGTTTEATKTETVVKDESGNEISSTTKIETETLVIETTSKPAESDALETETTITTTITATTEEIEENIKDVVDYLEDATSGSTPASISVVVKVEETTEVAIILSTETIEKISDLGAGLAVEGEDNSKIEIDADVLGNLEIDEGSEVKLSITETDKQDLSSTQQNAVKNEEVKIVKLNLEVDGEKVSDLKGTATVQVPFDAGENHDGTVYVYRINEDGTLTEVKGAVYDAEKKMVTFLRDSFSDYGIFKTKMVVDMPDFIPLPDRPQGGVEVTLPGNETPSEKENNTKIIACAAAAVVAAALALFLVIDTRRP